MEDVFKDYDYEKLYCPPGRYTCSDYTKLMFLIINADKINRNILREFISNEKNINQKNSNGETALMIAIMCPQEFNLIEEIKLIIKQGANINLQDRWGQSALMMTAKYSVGDNNLEIMKLLLDSGSNINLQDCYKQTALILSVRNTKKMQFK